MLSIHSFILFTLVLEACASTVETRDSCRKGYVPCTPKGASNAAEDVVHLYNNLVNSVATASHFRRDALQTDRMVERAAPLCCRWRALNPSHVRSLTISTGAEGMQCLLLDVDKVPFCWVCDRLTMSMISLLISTRTNSPQTSTSHPAGTAASRPATSPLLLER